ncbi:MAG TPA: antitoxin MazE family protein [Gammaproteobacteria bacterium]|nr:antitoxin MazE family protein [Gammaproteobacteria bacterium]
MQLNTTERVNKHRQGLRAAGLRPVQLWVPDTRRANFATECRRQSRLLQHDPQEDEILNLINEAADLDDWQ